MIDIVIEKVWSKLKLPHLYRCSCRSIPQKYFYTPHTPHTMTDLAIRLDTSRNLGEERDIRVEDYLNDKLQTLADLENLDSLLENVRNQHLLLTQQACLQIRAEGHRSLTEYLAPRCANHTRRI